MSWQVLFKIKYYIIIWKFFLENDEIYSWGSGILGECGHGEVIHILNKNILSLIILLKYIDSAIPRKV